MADHHIVVIGASAGGVEALSKLVKLLPAKLNAAIFVALHFPAGSVSFLPDILNRARTLPAAHAQNGEKIQRGRIYVAPPDYHLLIHTDTIEVNRGPKENGHRHTIDTMFRSAAQAHGPRVVGAVLTGMLDDGTWGLKAIKSQGGLALAQDPEEAMFRSMPDNAIAHVDIDMVLPLTDLAERIVELATDGGTDVVENSPMTAEQTETEDDDNLAQNEDKIVAQEKATAEQGKRPNSASPITCPDCGGVLWELQDRNNMLRFRCHIGHAYSLNSLMTQQGKTLERACNAPAGCLF